jgi:hypothetical protein
LLFLEFLDVSRIADSVKILYFCYEFGICHLVFILPCFIFKRI